MGCGRPVLALLAASLAVAGCGADDGAGDGRAGASGTEGVGVVRAGSTAQFANCGDWRRGTAAQRYTTIADIRGQLTPQSSTSEVSDLADRSAYRIFQKSCATPGSDQLRLYKLYARAQAFARFNPGA